MKSHKNKSPDLNLSSKLLQIVLNELLGWEATSVAGLFPMQTEPKETELGVLREETPRLLRQTQ